MSAHPMDGKQIKAARALLSWSQTDLCRVARISRATLNDIENDSGDPRLSSVRRVEDAFEKNGVIFLPENEGGGPGVRLRTPSAD